MHPSTHFYLFSFGSLARAASLLAALGGIDGDSQDANQQSGNQQSGCKPFYSTFPESDVTPNFFATSPFVAITPEDSYEATGDGLRMFLKKPDAPVTRQDHTNSVLGQGSTINSTFLLSYGRVTYEVAAPLVAGSVTAVIMIADGHDEVDVEILGSDSDHWQTNVYAPQSTDQKPLWGIFGSVEDTPEESGVDVFHNYTIDFNASRIIWSVDGNPVRTLKPSQTYINTTEHYPTQAMRIQLGIWDASGAEGTSEWAGGPIDWDNAPQTINATVKSVTVECD